jgi:hypothetical protein
MDVEVEVLMKDPPHGGPCTPSLAAAKSSQLEASSRNLPVDTVANCPRHISIIKVAKPCALLTLGVLFERY